MNDIERKLQTFLKVLYKSYPQLINNFKHSIKFEDIMYPGSNFVRTYDLRVEFPSQFRNKILCVASFCNLEFGHEYVDGDIHIFYTGQKQC